MNRLFIIGNGFDIAHGLKTKYCDFINDFWSNLLNEFKYPKHEIINSMVEVKLDFGASQYIIDKDRLDKDILEIDSFYSFNRFIGKYDKYGYSSNKLASYIFINKFFENITVKNGIQNWVDIEKEYYYQLKDIVKNEISLNDKTELVQTLNNEFDEVKELFEKYLKENVELQISNKIMISEIHEVFKILNWQPSLKNIEEYPNEDREALEVENKKKKGLVYGEILNNIYDGKIKEGTLVLNFNYTSLIKTYLKNDRLDSLFTHIQIHGNINDIKNKINFGFGDEMDEDYKMIENLDENEFLRNFKSFGYLQNINYKKLLDFIDSGKFQVIIMGHSCGISDRTMLNTIFEHPNCRSIKPFYYEWKDDEGNIKDNYTELVQNISRHFNKKKLMREKVVNKSLCKPLPQLQNE